MKILLTGATGFLGGHLLDNFLRHGHELIIIKRSESNLCRIFEQFGEVEAWDVNDDLEGLFSRSARIDAILHVATDYGRDSSRPTVTFWANEVFPMRLLEKAIVHNVPLFANIDTFFNSGKAHYNYLSAYSLSKRHFQEWGKHCAEACKIRFLNLRLSHLYGPGDNLQKFIPSMVSGCLAGEKIDLTEGEQKRDFIHINDVVGAVDMVLKTELGCAHGYRHYDIGTGVSISIREFVETVNQACGYRAILNFGALPHRQGEFEDACADSQALSNIGWVPKVNLAAGIRTVIEDLARRTTDD
jgi:CDP-paratose synthetase